MSSRILLFVGLISLMILSAAGVYFLLMGKSAPLTAAALPSDFIAIRYLPLGDSYTIGQSVNEFERWPNQLAATYNSGDKRLGLIGNPAVTGFTSKDLIDSELPLIRQLQPDFVTIQIGVNDFVRGVSPQVFKQNLTYIVGQLTSQLAQPKNILLITIPDFAKTPSGMTFGDPADATLGIESFNRIIKDVASESDLPVADIFGESQLVTTDPSLISPDGLHPSGKQYSGWTAIILKNLKEAELPI